MRRALLFCAAILAAAAAAAAGPTKGPSDEDCLACHGDPGAKRDNGRSIFADAKKLAASVHGQAGVACVDCHADLAKTSEFPHPAHLKPVDCASCHDDPGKAHPFHPDLATAAAGGKRSMKVSCAACHGGHDITPVKDPSFKFAPPKDIAACGSCHGDVQKHFLASEHGRAASGTARPPTCLSCHSQAITDGPDPGRLKLAQEQLCLSCHLRDRAVRNQVASSASFIASYEESVHGKALARGDARAPTCVDCHGAHDERKGFDTESFVNKMRVQEVCGRCHQNETRQFAGSVHGAALKKGNADAPACTSCHGEHSILSPKDPRSPVAAANVSSRTCAPCHGSVRLVEKWNLPRDRTETFADSFHGLAARGGSVEVANCASCHGTHDILPSANPMSRVAPANLAKTCGTAGCHPGANARFGAARVHVAATEQDSPLLYWISTIYILLIVGVVGAMLVHNLLDFVRKSRRQLAIRRGEIAEPPAGRALYLRMTLNERLQHGALLVSFTMLAVTGFMLRYPEASWVVLLRHAIPRSFDLRSALHRASAVVMIVASLYHVLYLSATQRGRALARDLWWTRHDLRDVAAALRYYLGLSSERPRFGRFSYVEKSEYWALVWGTVVMATTGIIMWLDNTFIGLLTKLGYDVARAVHFYEAWLATLAILVWHIYFVVFNPDSYPMNTAWLTGTLTEREMEEEHPLELERLREESASRDSEENVERTGDDPEPGGNA